MDCCRCRCCYCCRNKSWARASSWGGTMARYWFMAALAAVMNVTKSRCDSSSSGCFSW